MQRRDLLKLLAGSPLLFSGLPVFADSKPRWDRILVLIELKGANDSLNTFIPYTDPLYYQYRPRLAIPRDKVLPLGEQIGLHPALQPLLPLWEKKQIALVHCEIEPAKTFADLLRQNKMGPVFIPAKGESMPRVCCWRQPWR